MFIWVHISKPVCVHGGRQRSLGASSSITPHIIYFIFVSFEYVCDISVYVYTCSLGMWVHANLWIHTHAHTDTHAHTHWCRGLKLTSNNLDHVLLSLLRQGFSLASQLAAGIPPSPFLESCMAGVCHVFLALMWVLGIRTLILTTVVQPEIYPSSHLLSSALIFAT